MVGIYAGKTGRPSYPLLTLLRASLPGIWYRLSGVEPARALFRDLLFRKFCHPEPGGSVPDATMIGRFRLKLVGHDPWEVLPGGINRQLEDRRIIMTEGRTDIIDATPVGGCGRDPARAQMAGQPVMRRLAGMSGPTAAATRNPPVATRFVPAWTRTGSHRQSVTAGNVHDSTGCYTLMPGDETALYADAAYSSKATRLKLARFGIADRVQRKGYRGHPLSDANEARNAEIAVTGSGGERPFATCKSRYGLARTRLMGLAKNLTLSGLTAITHNIRKGAKFLHLYGLPEPACAG